MNAKNLNSMEKMTSMGNGNYTDQDKNNIKFMADFYEQKRHTITKSKNIIKVDFKNKKVKSGVSIEVRKRVNNLY